ncbi:YncE family protein [Kitasatospora sp. LaBMicrA B282]|uniref:YncE family protein n=1 Tax=Kitasatospora sp. LaBMicrA B282 TaxID=3420949 RepID=UPI003D13BB4F
MRHQTVSRAAAAAISAGVLASAGLFTAPAEAAAPPATTTVALPIAHYSHLLVDAAHQHLFISSGPGYGTILVTDFSGQTVATLANEPGATGLALSPDGGTVYAALAGGDAVSAIDTTSLTETARYATGAGTTPTYVAATAGKVWFGYGGAAQGGIGSIDPSTSPATVTLRAAAGTWYSAPLVVANPNGELVAAEPGQSPDQLASYDVSGGTATVLAAQQYVMSAGNLIDLQLTPDGSQVVTASGSPYYHQVFKVADLSQAGQYNSSTYPNAVTVAADGTVLAGVYNPGGTSVYVFAPGNAAPLRSYGLSGTLAPAGLAVSGDGSELFAIAADGSGGHPVLNIIPTPEQAAATLTVTGPTGAAAGSELTLTGSLGGAAPFTGGQNVHVTRVDAADPDGVALPDVTTAADGSFGVTDVPPAGGTVTYQLSFDGTTHLAAASTSTTVTVTP